MADDPRQGRAKKLHIDKGWTYDAIADHFGVSRRTVNRWAVAGRWADEREVKSANVVSVEFGSREGVDTPPTPSARSGRRLRQDERSIVEGAIEDLADAMNIAKSEDLRALGGLAGALVRLLEYRRRLVPPTAAELAEQAIALGIPPHEFIRELKEKWSAQA